jgi:hypothetical protein
MQTKKLAGTKISFDTNRDHMAHNEGLLNKKVKVTSRKKTQRNPAAG